ncbi:thiamine pyrophosphate-binding protein [Roseisalinus antarcticus]|uniref:Pyruvate oxidase n=1 Tax=Roseisalinus antarcticus TaxID=254357 RepID=A0A1Y5TC67_9RHOB|nr:thiamine pyrophosphate-binding protein [Roseisalinus antarcticus]SLN57096.1 pyruvate oxidase [Roseisalinus antarcticus]
MSRDDGAEPWHETVIRVLKENEVDLVTYIPDNVLRELIDALHADPYFTVICPAREEEAVAIVAGAYMAGRRGIVLMQTSGFATLPNALASLVVPFQIPVVMMISERGILGEFQIGQAIVCKTMRPVLQSIGIEHHTIEEHDHVPFVVDSMIRQAFATRSPAAIILSPLLTKRPRAGAAQ